MDEDLQQRRRPAHGLMTFSHQPTLVFVTVCTKERRRWLADPLVEAQLIRAWTAADTWQVGRYVLMPDHLHLFAAQQDIDVTLERWMRYWKSLFTRAHRDPEHRWQSDHWDTRLRTVHSYEEKWHYVRLNPVRHGLVVSADDWPFQGELNPFEW